MGNKTETIKIPDIGGAENVDVIDVLVKVGDVVKPEDSLITLEGDKATMDIPSPMAGKVSELQVKTGDKVSQGSSILVLSVEAGSESEAAEATKAEKEEKKPETTKKEAPVEKQEAIAVSGVDVHAGPSARRIARELDLDLHKIKGTGEKNRVTKEDVQAFVKTKLKQAETGSSGAGLNLAPMPAIDFSKFGDIEKQPLNKIKKLTGANLSRNWVTIPHVTQFGEADITELEAFRQLEKKTAEKQGVRLTPIVFIMKAVISALKEFPHFNASLSENGEELILKKYFHLGVAVDTPKGLVVPVVRDAETKSLVELARELGKISKKAREKGLTMVEMQGGCFSISSLGGIGGTAFTPIINAPEVAILGVSRTETKPVFIDGEFVPRLMLPLSLSYDHRVIDGADGARFLMHVCKSLSDIRTLLL